MSIISGGMAFWHFSLSGLWLLTIQIRSGSTAAKLDIVKLAWSVLLTHRRYISIHEAFEALTDTFINISGSDTLDAFKSAASSANGQDVPAMAQGGILGTPSAGQTTATSSSKTATSGSATTSSSAATSSMTTTSSTSTASGTQTSAGGSSPSATNMAENLHASTDISVLSILTLIMAMFLM